MIIVCPAVILSKQPLPLLPNGIQPMPGCKIEAQSMISEFPPPLLVSLSHGEQEPRLTVSWLGQKQIEFWIPQKMWGPEKRVTGLRANRWGGGRLQGHMAAAGESLPQRPTDSAHLPDAGVPLWAWGALG